jgi:hypothetical protein
MPSPTPYEPQLASYKLQGSVDVPKTGIPHQYFPAISSPRKTHPTSDNVDEYNLNASPRRNDLSANGAFGSVGAFDAGVSGISGWRAGCDGLEIQ